MIPKFNVTWLALHIHFVYYVGILLNITHKWLHLCVPSKKNVNFNYKRGSNYV